MKDPTERLRRGMIASGAPERDLKAADKRYTTEEMSKEFKVNSFMAPFVFVTRKADGVDGTMEFTHSPRFYFNFKADDEVVK